MGPSLAPERGVSALPAVAELVPHAPPMVLLDALVAHEAASTTARATVRADHPLLRDGRLPAVAALELVAQAAAARRGLQLRERRDAPRVGFVVGAPRVELLADAVDVGAELVIVVRPVGEEHEEGLRVLEGEVHADGSLVARVTVQVVERREGA